MIWTIASRELRTRGRSKGFLITTGILFAGVIAVALIATLLSGDSEGREVTVGLTADAERFGDALELGTDDLEVTINVVGANDETLVEDGTLDVLFDGSSLTWDGRPDNELDGFVRFTVQQVLFAERADGLGLGEADVAQLFLVVEIDEVRLDGGDDDFAVRFAAAGVSGFATFMLLQTWGAFLMMGVIEEKSSRVVEVLLSHVRPSTLLSGKVLGLGILALLQMLVVALGLVVGLLLVDTIDIPASVWATVPLLLVTFVLSFGFYATAFAAVGSMVSRQEDATTAQLPAILPLVVGYVIAVSSISEPDNLAVTIGSFVPFTSPVLLPFRTAMTDVPAWQVILSLVILAVSIFVMINVAGRIYRYSLLRIGGRVTWSDAWKNRNQIGL